MTIQKFDYKLTNVLLVDNLKSNTKRLGTLPGITNWNEWMWPDEGAKQGFIYAQPLPGIGI